ncbi:MAG: GNAT family N-acetyltransferase [Peptococcaceae bacterium]|nr:GNAT family N-acetyltransferase [Peptococcaceae bacterium]
MLVAENETGEVIGYTAVHWLPYLILAGPEGYVSELFIRRSVRGNGVGRMLLEEVKKQAVLRGCSRLLLLNGRNRESYVRGFYKKLGGGSIGELSMPQVKIHISDLLNDEIIIILKGYNESIILTQFLPAFFAL